jgi:hypothetical protein
MNAADYIPVFLHYEPGSAVRYYEVFHSCADLLYEEHGPVPTPMRDFNDALLAAGYHARKTGRSGVPGRIKIIRDAAWNDHQLAIEAEARRNIREAKKRRRDCR